MDNCGYCGNSNFDEKFQKSPVDKLDNQFTLSKKGRIPVKSRHWEIVENRLSQQENELSTIYPQFVDNIT
ncbi:MAG TPA: hypothetical protein IAB98_12820 [Candidatus Egerieimonas intestinavium]|uniref:Uncharacterized protein n=1 Tax=Candidatus Egerieimonas intestinavium TaxID=2840777 RepID=A0A9D1ELZ4_9FIRM|nr:hypothetical protein [Candidatus Egerieimonas intestinavium]